VPGARQVEAERRAGGELRRGRLLGAIFISSAVGKGSEVGVGYRGFVSLISSGWRMPIKGKLRYCPL
jgi:hypothetical protein